jgi:hypothetical protein
VYSKRSAPNSITNSGISPHKFITIQTKTNEHRAEELIDKHLPVAHCHVKNYILLAPIAPH